ncbi:MAG TPA: EAL domain-containing protein [Bradyrhizobium sp.]|uniref:bifunctional diguanylate cyclase/phosphodiesterase n=1 Tax=Bradyrhizobium sp. TaxID=376 RepID=UPI002CB08BD6|nr:EAL domain-containing protein [Bradyrhizobium sp.]HTB03114.1 EAL domain-containing protein [Bradyrhizobium sp.]
MKASGNSLFDLKSLVSDGPIRWLFLCGALLIAAIAIGTVVTVDNFRERALQSSERELENTVLLLARHFDQQLDDFTVIQKDVVAQVERSGTSSAEVFRRQMATPEWHEMLRARVAGYSDFAGVNVFDAEGTLINSSEAWPVLPITIADRAYFRAFKSGFAARPVLVELVPSRLGEGGWATVISQPVTGPEGEFLGLVTRAITPASFEKFFASVVLGENAAISMYHRDGTLLARYPHVEDMIGRNFGDGPLQQILSKSSHGTMRLTGSLDGVDRLASIRALSNFPISIAATTTVAAALAAWQQQTQFLIGGAGLSVLIIIGILSLIVRKLLQQHQLEKQRLDTALDNMTQGLLLFDSSQRLVVCNQRYVEMFGVSTDVVKPGCTIHELLQHRKDTGSFSGDVDQYCSALAQKMTQGEIFQTILDAADGGSIRVMYRPLSQGGWVATLEDITERRRAEERITHLAHYDALTDLPNRTLFQEKLGRELARMREGEQLAVFYIDIDEFKSVNDTLGHLIGDELLKSVAASLGRCVTESDFVARLGGDEFAVVQTAVKDRQDVVDLVTRIYHAIREPYECLGHQVSTDASVGIALAPQHGGDLDQLLKNADLAMYAAKTAGRRTYRFFEPEMDARVRARRVLEMDLRQAIAAGALEVHYQPSLDLRDDRITGCEALLRWRHPERGMIPPSEFIPVAEETGLISELGTWVLATACAEAATWPDDIKLAVNVSPIQFKDDTFALKVVAALAASGLPASRLELEITEAVLIRDDEAALAILHQLRAAGVRIALDDFGTGYSSLSYLQRFPFDKIKIDRCFVDTIVESSSIVQAVVNIAAARNIITTAEGVETEQQRDLLRTLGCAEMQGYLFSPARPAAVLRQLLFSHRGSRETAGARPRAQGSVGRAQRGNPFQ